MFWHTPQPEYYKILNATSIRGIEKKASLLIAEWWQPTGGTFRNLFGMYYQAFWRPQEK